MNTNANPVFLPKKVKFDDKKGYDIAQISSAEEHSGIVTTCGKLLMAGVFLHDKLGFAPR